jgi:hypothetical protein
MSQHERTTSPAAAQQQQRSPLLFASASLPEAAKLMLAGGVSGVLAKTATAPLGRLTILYQVSRHAPSSNHSQATTVSPICCWLVAAWHHVHMALMRQKYLVQMPQTACKLCYQACQIALHAYCS